MVTNSLHLDGVETFSVDIIVFVLRGSLQSDVSSVNTSSYTREPSAEVERVFYCGTFVVCQWPLDKAWLF